jgi:hypothetical protein
MVHVPSTTWRIKNQPSISTSCSNNALRLLVLVTRRLYQGLQVTSSFPIWGCILKGCFERGLFWRALKTSLLNIETYTHLRGIYRMYSKSSKEKPKDHNMLDLETLGNWAMMPKNLSAQLTLKVSSAWFLNVVAGQVLTVQSNDNNKQQNNIIISNNTQPPILYEFGGCSLNVPPSIVRI